MGNKPKGKWGKKLAKQQLGQENVFNRNFRNFHNFRLFASIQAMLKIDLPDNATATASTCNDTKANFILTFYDEWTMAMYFTRKDYNEKSNGTYELNSFNLTYKYDSHFINASKQSRCNL